MVRRSLVRLVLPVAAALVACGEPANEEPPAPGPTSPDLAAPVPPGEVRAGIVTREIELLSGLKADGQLGDAKLVNATAAFVVEGVRRASGYRYWGGNLVDAVPISPDGAAGEDRYGEIFFAWDLQVFEPETLEVLSDGGDGEAHVRLTGRSVPFAWADSFVRDIVDPPPAEVELVHDYRLAPDDPELRLRITVKNPRAGPWTIGYPLLLANFGDGAAPYAPGPGLSGPALGAAPYVAALGRELGYGFVADAPDLELLFEYQAVSLYARSPFELVAGGVRSFEYRFVVTERSASGLDDWHREREGAGAAGRLTGLVELPETASTRDAWIAAFSGTDVATLAPVGDDGAFEVSLPPGGYGVQAFAHRHAYDGPVAVQVAAGASAQVTLAVPAAGRVRSTIVDGTGAPIPGRVTFLREGSTPTPWAPPEVRLGSAWPDAVGGVAYVIEGGEELVLPAGDYRAIASRGFSYELDEQPVVVAPGGSVEVAFTLERAVDTSGWLSGDFHLHAALSPDSDVPYEIRVLQAATEDLDVPVLTEHVYASTLGPTAEAMGLGQRVHGISGQEVTTFAYGHFNAFPLVWDAAAINDGGVVEHGFSPQELFAAMRAQNPEDEIVQVNHPRSDTMKGYFEWVGLDAAAGTVRKPEGWDTSFDAVEAFNGDCGPAPANRPLADWIGLTNRGSRHALSSGSDSHSESRLPGTPRQWIELDAAALRADPQALVAAVRGRRMIVSCGPFVRFRAADGTGLGGTTRVDAEGEVAFDVSVEAPRWIQLDRARLLENGLEVASWDLAGTPDGPVRLSTTARVRPTVDSWYVLEVLGSGSLAPVTWASAPYALTNPIEVDADRDGTWTPPVR